VQAWQEVSASAFFEDEEESSSEVQEEDEVVRLSGARLKAVKKYVDVCILKVRSCKKQREWRKEGHQSWASLNLSSDRISQLIMPLVCLLVVSLS
jgi:hypothetical protein